MIIYENFNQVSTAGDKHERNGRNDNADTAIWQKQLGKGQMPPSASEFGLTGMRCREIVMVDLSGTPVQDKFGLVHVQDR